MQAVRYFCQDSRAALFFLGLIRNFGRLEKTAQLGRQYGRFRGVVRREEERLCSVKQDSGADYFIEYDQRHRHH